MKKLATVMALILTIGCFPAIALAQSSPMDSYGSNITVLNSEIGMNHDLDGDIEINEDENGNADVSEGRENLPKEEENESEGKETDGEELEEEAEKDESDEGDIEGKELFLPILLDLAGTNYAADFTELRDLITGAPADGTETVIYISGDIEMNGSISLSGKNINLQSDPDSGETYRLYYGGGSMFFSLINGSVLTLENIVLDGLDESFSEFIGINGLSMLNINDGTVIENAVVSQGINVYGASLEINSGEIRNIQNTEGVIFCDSGNLVINGGKFYDNIRSLGSGSIYGGVVAVVRAGLTITGGEFINNYSYISGGAVGVWTASGSGPIVIENAVFTGNETEGRGGGVYTYQTTENVTISNCIFTDNTAKEYGGAVALTSSTTTTHTVTNTIFDNNTSATQYGGGLFIQQQNNSNSKTILTNVSATNNHAGYAGGGIYVSGDTQDVEITNLNVSNNLTGIFVGSDSLYSVGGGMYISAGGGTVDFIGTNLIKDNILTNQNPNATQRSDGGGLMVTGTSSAGNVTLDISGTLTLENNEITTLTDTANYGGGAFFMRTDANLENFIVQHNRTDGNGGGLGFGSSTVTIKDSEIYRNYADKGGGGIYLSVVFPTIENTKISHNTAFASGGGIAFATNVTTGGLTLSDNTELTYNRALNGDGGGIYMYHNGGVPVQSLVNSDADTYFYGNSAPESYEPPANADTVYNTIGYSSTSIDVHPLNNFDINYTDTPPTNGFVTINYDPNGGTGDPYTLNWDISKPYTVLDRDFFGYEKGGYTFTGWSFDEKAEAADIFAGDKLEGFSGGDEITLYAQWQEIKYTATINYHPNGGIGTVYTEIWDIAAPYTVLDNDITGFIYQDHDFTGWSKTSGVQTVDYNADDVISGLTNNQIIDLYAQWQEIKTTTPPPDETGGGNGGGEGNLKQPHKVTFYWNDGTDNIYATDSVDDGGRVTRPEDPEREEFIFTGWYTTPECNTLYNFSAPVHGNLRLYAGWQPQLLLMFTPDHYAYIVGYDNGTVRPEGQITRAEVATIFFRLLDDEYRDTVYGKTNAYSDVTADNWFNTAVSTMSNAGVLHGYPDGSFNPNGFITRGEFATIIAQFTGAQYTGGNLFSDTTEHWAKQYINIAKDIGWIEGYPDGTYRPDNFITRGETVSLVNRILERNPESPEDLHEDMILWPDNGDTSKWYYLDIQEATNSHEYDRKDNGRETWTELRENRDWVLLER